MEDDFGTRIVTEIASREGVDPTMLEPPLHDVIDPEALNALFAPTRRSPRTDSGRVSFTYNGYDVTVTATGSVSITETCGDGNAGSTTTESTVD